MKIGILTFHDGINHGAFMQAFSTYQYLLQSGFDAEIINYKNKKHYFNELKAFLIKKKPSKIIENINKIRAFKHAHKEMNLNRLTFDINNIKGIYDAVVVGSDIVWNYELKFLGNDPIYFGKGLESSKLISYAPSFGNVSQNNIPPDYVKKGLSDFKSISVRDENSACIIESILGHRPPIVLDPTFLIDSEPFETPIQFYEPYILVYAYCLKKSEIESTLKYAQNNELKIISIGYKNNWADINIVSLGPFEWLSFFKNASYVLTSTFHGTLFSIKYKKNFATSINDNIKNKTSSLLSYLELDEQFINNGAIEFIYEKKVNYDKVHEKLIPLIDSSKKYLIESLNQ